MESFDFPPGKVLIVDDNEPSAKTLGWTMEILGQQVQTAFTSEAAIPLALSFQPDIIFLDLSLPGMNGYELCKLLRQEPTLQHTLFIAQTGWDQQEHRQRSQEAGFHRHLVKPIDMKALQEVLQFRQKVA